jgi:hypothetical protein
MAVYGSIWQHITVYGSILQYMAAYGSIWQYLNMAFGRLGCQAVQVLYLVTDVSGRPFAPILRGLLESCRRLQLHRVGSFKTQITVLEITLILNCSMQI